VVLSFGCLRTLTRDCAPEPDRAVMEAQRQQRGVVREGYRSKLIALHEVACRAPIQYSIAVNADRPHDATSFASPFHYIPVASIDGDLKGWRERFGGIPGAGRPVDLSTPLPRRPFAAASGEALDDVGVRRRPKNNACCQT